jgi:hypothetical protein
MTPIDVPASPPYANGYILYKDGEVMTILFCRVPIPYTETQLTALKGMKELPSPVVSSVTLTMEGARTFLGLLTRTLDPTNKAE